MRVLVIGAGGIVGQHMMLSKPNHIQAVYTRLYRHAPFDELDISKFADVAKMLDDFGPDVVVNLAGQNNVDEVQKHANVYYHENAIAPKYLAMLCQRKRIHFIQASTQGVFSGENAPYRASDTPHPITEYGKQKRKAELAVLGYEGVCVARITFVLGIRPMSTGRRNPLEQMFSSDWQRQVNDRWFSPAWAPDVARQLWKLVENRHKGIVHIGEPVKTTRYQIACQVYHELALPLEKRPKIIEASHEEFYGLAPRPRDTTWAYGSMYDTKTLENIIDGYHQWKRKFSEFTR